jgi:hypothetical protein
MGKLLIEVACIFIVARAFAQKMTVKIINREDNETDYTYVVPRYVTSNSDEVLPKI